MNVHNEILGLKYSMKNGAILELQPKVRYIVCKYDGETMRELAETSNRTDVLDFSGMMAIRQELLPLTICQFYPADIPRTWFIAFFRLRDRLLDSLPNAVDGRNVEVVLNQFRKKGLGDDLQGALWYSKTPDGYFAVNPHNDQSIGLPTLTEFLSDEQFGWRGSTGSGVYGSRGTVAKNIQMVGDQTPIPSMEAVQKITLEQIEEAYGSAMFGRDYFNIRWDGNVYPSYGRTPKASANPTPKPQPVKPIRPNALGRLIDLED